MLPGPLAAGFGFVYLRAVPQAVVGIVVFAAGGILYRSFEHTAPQAQLKQHWAPPLGAVAGFFMAGLAGDALVAGARRARFPGAGGQCTILSVRWDAPFGSASAGTGPQSDLDVSLKVVTG